MINDVFYWQVFHVDIVNLNLDISLNSDERSHHKPMFVTRHDTMCERRATVTSNCTVSEGFKFGGTTEGEQSRKFSVIVKCRVLARCCIVSVKENLIFSDTYSRFATRVLLTPFTSRLDREEGWCSA